MSKQDDDSFRSVSRALDDVKRDISALHLCHL